MKWYGICEVLDFESRCWDMVSIQCLWLNFSIEIKLQIKVCGFLSDFHWIAEFSLKISFLRTNISILIQGLQVSPVFLRFEASRFTPFSTPPKAAPTGMERPKVKSAGTTPTAAPTTVPAHNPVAAPGGQWWDVQTTNRSGNLSYPYSQKIRWAVFKNLWHIRFHWLVTRGSSNWLFISIWLGHKIPIDTHNNLGFWSLLRCSMSPFACGTQGGSTTCHAHCSCTNMAILSKGLSLVASLKQVHSAKNKVWNHGVNCISLEFPKNLGILCFFPGQVTNFQPVTIEIFQHWKDWPDPSGTWGTLCDSGNWRHKEWLYPIPWSPSWL